jgi:hypothetical protein
MVEAKLFTKMAISIEEILSMDFAEDMVSMNLKVNSSMRESGKKTFFMEKENCFVKNSYSLMVSSKMGLNMVQGCTGTRMVIIFKVLFTKIKKEDMDYTIFMKEGNFNLTIVRIQLKYPK